MTTFDNTASPSTPRKTRMQEPKAEGCASTIFPSTPTPSRKKPQRLRTAASAPSTPSGSKPLLYVYSWGNDTTIYGDEQHVSSAARQGLADGSFHKMEVTPSVTDAFTHAAESVKGCRSLDRH
ncbi:hypothetical protein K438DRAFT_1956650 [Mycena galopus ATCC 62051]|nr:hypothetical protein K438DRAFT_1956650 [Mycena galopus ATCC 62051]